MANNKGVDAVHAGDLPKTCSRDRKPATLFIVKRTKDRSLCWLEVYCHECFNLELDDIMLKNNGESNGRKRRR